MRKIRVLISKPGLDGHDRGAKVLCRFLRDAGIEVIYTGLHQTPRQIVNAAIQEDVDVIGISILTGAHLPLTRKIIDELRLKEALEEKMILVGGNIPREDIPELKDMGVREVFRTGSDPHEVISFIKANCLAK